MISSDFHEHLWRNGGKCRVHKYLNCTDRCVIIPESQRMEEVPTFKKGAVYALINKAVDFAIKPKETDPKKYEESRLVGVPYNPADDSQLFFIDRVGKNADDFEFVNLKTGLVLSEDGKEVLLEFGKQKSSQLFAIVKSGYPGFFTYYWIRTSVKGDKSVYLEGSLKYGPFDPNSESHLWRLEEVKLNPTINTSFVLINRLSGKALDVPAASIQPGERIIQFEINRRFNQRWKWVKHDKGYLIQSVHSGFVLDIAGESRESGAKVVQWKRTGNPNQQWLLEPAGNGVYKIRSIHESSMFLGIKNQDVDDGGKLETTNKENPSIYWIIEGALP